MTRKTERVVVRFKSDAEYGLHDAETARRVYPNAQIVRYADGRPYPDAEPETADPAQPETGDSEPGTVSPADQLDLDKASRDQLDAYAPSVGVDPADYSRKGDLLKAVKAARAEREGES